MDIILLFLAKPLDKHGTTLVHITYPPLDTGKQNVLLPDESNTIMFSDTGKQNVMLPDESIKIMFSPGGGGAGSKV